MNKQGRRHNGAKKRAFYDEEFDLVQNNGRVTLPLGTTGVPLTRKQLRFLLFLASSAFVAFIVGRK